MPACEIGYLQDDGTPMYFEGFRNSGQSAKFHSERAYAYLFSNATSALDAALVHIADLDRPFFIFSLNAAAGTTPLFRAAPTPNRDPTPSSPFTAVHEDPNMNDAQKWNVLKINSLGREFLTYRNNGWCWSTEQADAAQFDGYKEAQLIVDTHLKEKTGVAVVRFTYVPVKERLEVLRSHYDELTLNIEQNTRDGCTAPDLIKEQQAVWEQILRLAQKGDTQS